MLYDMLKGCDISYNHALRHLRTPLTQFLLMATVDPTLKASTNMSSLKDARQNIQEQNKMWIK